MLFANLLLKEERSTPLTQEEILHSMEKDKQEDIEKDAEKLNHEAKKIAHLQHKIIKKEEKYAELEKEISEDEKKLEDISQVEKVKEAEKKLKKLQEGHDPESSLKGKIEEVFQEAKDFTKDLCSAHKCLAGGKERNSHEKMENRADKKLKAAKKHIEELKAELANKLAEKIEEDNEKLHKKAKEIEELKEKLKNEERRYAEIEKEMAYDQLCEAKILEAERKLRGKDQKSPCHGHHHEHEID